MWNLKILTGSHQGESYSLKSGSYILGRDSSCDICIENPGISKKHAQLLVSPSGVFVKDLKSTNGIFINGVKMPEGQVKSKDKISFHNVFVEFESNNSLPIAFPQASSQDLITQGNLAYDNLSEEQNALNANPENKVTVSQNLSGLTQWFKDYSENVILPGVYKLPELMELKWVLGLFLAGFILCVTSLSSVPLVRILKGSIEEESQRRALTIAKTLTVVNRDLVSQGVNSALSVLFAEKELGVKEAYILDSLDGSILAPARRGGSFPDIPFVHEARKLGKEGMKQIDDNTIVAVSPISVYDSTKGSLSQRALSVVVYDMGSLAVDDQRILNLVIQTFFIALVLGLILYFFMYKVISYPIHSLNTQLDSALKSETGLISSSYEFPILQKFVSNINSALNRILEPALVQGEEVIEQDRSLEMESLVQVVGFPALVVRHGDLTVTAINPQFEELSGHNSSDLLYKNINEISDESLKLTLDDLIRSSEEKSNTPAQMTLTFSGIPYDLVLQSIYGSKDISYYLIVVIPSEEEEEDYGSFSS